MSRHLRDLLKMLEHATYTDSYGVYGSDFTVCRLCESESGAGALFKANWHKAWCPVPRLKRKYDRQLKSGERGDHSEEAVVPCAGTTASAL